VQQVSVLEEKCACLPVLRKEAKQQSKQKLKPVCKRFRFTPFTLSTHSCSEYLFALTFTLSFSLSFLFPSLFHIHILHIVYISDHLL
jgi:hypothetical protein